MNTVDWSEGTRTSWGELPAAVTTYLSAHGAGDPAAAIATFTADAVVTDEGHSYAGREEIANWMANASGEYTFTTEFATATAIDSGHVDVVQHLEGDFPGGVADLHFRFSLEGASISRLVLEP